MKIEKRNFPNPDPKFLSLGSIIMSSAAPQGPGGGRGSGPAAAPQRYFCHQCDHTVSITPSASGELLCPDCHGGFIEEFDLPPSNPNPNPNPNPTFSFESHQDPFFSPFLFPSPSPASSLDIRSPTDLAGLFGGLAGGGGPHTATFRSSSSSSSHGSEPFNPMQFIQNYLQSMVGDGANIQFVFEGGGGGSPFAGNFGDYFIGPGLEQLIQQLTENDPNRYGTPPASKSAVDSLPDVKISQDMIEADDGAQCAVCKDEFEIGAEAKQMPCKHLYHKDCIIPWLELHNSCPVCRFELPTDDPDYENQRSGMEGQEPAAPERASGGIELTAAAAGGGAEGNAVRGPRMAERRLRIPLPWAFMGPESQAEASNAGSDMSGSGGNGDGGSAGPGQETRQEDLD